MIGNNEELNDYLINAKGLSRINLNLMCFIGFLSFCFTSLGAILLGVTFSFLRKHLGWIYLLIILAIFRITGIRSGLLFGISQKSAPFIRLISSIITYIIGWIHANIILSRYKSLAKQRIKEIEKLVANDHKVDFLLELGLLEWKVFRQKESCISILMKALYMPGGDPQLLNLAGKYLKAKKHYEDAKMFFDRALKNTKGEQLIKY